jgi:cyclophilin family peptidyl-prolyl cis-trans isomerase
MSYRVLFAVALMALVVRPAFSQEQPKAEPVAKPSPDENQYTYVLLGDEPATPPAAAATGERAQFDQTFTQWKDLLGKMRELRLQFKTAKPADQPAIEAQFKELTTQAAALLPQLKSSAEAAYKAAPPSDVELNRFMESMVVDRLQSDDYEEALRIAREMIDHGHQNAAVYAMAGMAAFQASDYDAAESYFKTAEEKKSLSPQAKQMQSQLPEYKELWAKEKAIRDKEAAADDLPRVKFQTDKGDIVIELFENEAPNAVANFISLVEKGFYDGLTFHRVLGGFMAQGGDPKGDGSGGPGYTIACECYQDNHRNHFRGSLSMAHAGRDTGGSQFFLTFVRTAHLDGAHTVFGRVIDGWSVLAALQRRDPDAGAGVPPDRIIKATVLRKRDHAYEPVKGPDK